MLSRTVLVARARRLSCSCSACVLWRVSDAASALVDPDRVRWRLHRADHRARADSSPSFCSARRCSCLRRRRVGRRGASGSSSRSIGLWANLHGGVLVGLAVAAGYLVLERARRDPLVVPGVLAACRSALFLTPAFASSGGYYLGVLRSEAAVRGEGMWAPFSCNAPFDVLFVFLAIPLLVFAFRSGLRPWELACIAAFAVLTLHAGRNAIWLLCFIAAPAAHGLGKRFLRDFTVSPRTLVICAGSRRCSS